MKLAELLSSGTAAAGIVLVFVEPPESASRLPALLSEQIVKLTVPYPRADELRVMAREEIALVAHRTKTMLSVDAIREGAEALTDGLVGTTRKAAQDALRDALCDAPTNFKAAAVHLKKRKVERLSRELAMNVLDTDDVEMPIGLDNLMQYLEMHKDRMRLTGNGRARGLMACGPPGTGKSMFARAVGKVVDLPVIEFRISSLMNSLLGETENRFAQAFATLEVQSPSVVYIDEFEKAFGDSSERDGGTMKRVGGAFLTWLQDNPYPNFILGTSNSLENMGQIGKTMMRSGRFDALFFVDVPSKDARIKMIERWLQDRIPSAGMAARQLAEETEKFSGADLYSMIKLAAARAEHSGQTLSLEHLREEAIRKHPRVLALYEEFRDLRRWGNIYCEPAGLTN
jgi:AAA+ superfamily predicted ATPase